jgi:aerobic carbon-monoxide dehydrogenase medium subunit
LKPAPFEYHDPRTLKDALDLLARHRDDAKILAGGQSLVPMLNFRLARPRVLIDINRITELDYLREDNGVTRIGALIRQCTLERWARARFPLLAEVLRHIGHAAIRTRGTVAGSIAHADPAAELPALLLALDGSVVARSGNGMRQIAARDLFRFPLTTALRPNEMITEVRLPALPAGAGWSIMEVTRRHGDFALVGVVAITTLVTKKIDTVRVAVFGCGGTAVRASAAEQALAGQAPLPAKIDRAASEAASRLTPESDLHASAAYRTQVARTLIARALSAAVDRIHGAAPGAAARGAVSATGATPPPRTAPPSGTA